MLQKHPSSVTMPIFRLLQRSLTAMHESLASTCDANLYMLRYLVSASKTQRAKQLEEKPSNNRVVEEEQPIMEA
jgi:hypothetical protein